jgi:hypothetical protein
VDVMVSRTSADPLVANRPNRLSCYRHRLNGPRELRHEKRETPFVSLPCIRSLRKRLAESRRHEANRDADENQGMTDAGRLRCPVAVVGKGLLRGKREADNQDCGPCQSERGYFVRPESLPGQAGVPENENRQKYALQPSSRWCGHVHSLIHRRRNPDAMSHCRISAPNSSNSVSVTEPLALAPIAVAILYKLGSTVAVIVASAVTAISMAASYRSPAHKLLKKLPTKTRHSRDRSKFLAAPAADRWIASRCKSVRPDRGSQRRHNKFQSHRPREALGTSMPCCQRHRGPRFRSGASNLKIRTNGS